MTTPKIQFEEVPFEPLQYRNPIWHNAEHTYIACEVRDPNVVEEVWIEYGAASYDPDPRGLELFNRIVAEGTALAYVPLTNAEKRRRIPELTQKQMRLALLAAGTNSAALDTAIAGLPVASREKAKIIFTHASYFTRLDPSVIVVLHHLNMTNQEIDAFWNQALTL